MRGMSVTARVSEEARRKSAETGKTLLSPMMAIEEFDLIAEDPSKLFAELKRKFGLEPAGKAFSAYIYDRDEIEKVLREAGYLS